MAGKKKAKSGKPFEGLIRDIERVVSGKPGVTIEAPKMLLDRVTKQEREHDVVVTFGAGHHTSIVSLECRDRSRKVTVNDVEGFHAKCRDCGVNAGAIVSPKGFSKTALEKATFYGIRALRIDESHAFDWLLAPGVMVVDRNLKDIRYYFDVGDAKPDKWTLVTPDGPTMDMNALTPMVREQFVKLFPQHKDQPSSGKVAIKFPGLDLRLRDDATGEIHNVNSWVAECSYQTTETLSEFRRVAYKDEGAGGTIADVAVADVAALGKVMWVNKPDGGADFVFVPPQNAGSSPTK